MTNPERAERARAALKAYIAKSDPGAELETAATDLLADLLHLSDVEDDFEFYDALHAATNHHYCETHGEE